MINAFKQIRLTNLGVSGANGRLNVNASGLAYYSELTGTSGVLQTNIASSGSNLQNQITSLSGTLTGQYLLSSTASSTYATISNLATTGSTLTNRIDSLSGTLTGSYLLSSTASSTYATISNLASTGNTLSSRISSLSGTLTGDYLTTGNAASTYATITNLASTGSTLQGQIDNLGNTYVTLGTTQTISGAKTFTNSVYIKDLFVTGTQTIVNTQVTNVGSNYLNLNATGGARDGGLFINLNSGGPNTSGAYIGFDIPSNTFRIGTGVSGIADLNVLDTIATQAYVASYVGGSPANIVYTTGTQTISGAKTFDSAVSLNTQATTTSHAVRADRNINGGSGLSNGGNLTSDVTLNVGQGYGISVSADAVAVNTSEVVVTTGNQNIAGNKTFSGNVSAGYITSPTIDTDSLTVSTGGVFNRFTANELGVRISDDSGKYGLNFATGTSNKFTFLLNGPSGYIDLVSGIISGKNISGQNIYQGTNRVVDSSQTGSFATTGQLSNIVYTTGTQTVGGDKTFDVTESFKVLVQGDEAGSKIDLNTAGEIFYIKGPDSIGTLINFTTPLITGFTNIAGTNIYQNGYKVLTINDTGNFASVQNLAQTGSTLQTQISSLSGTLTGNYVTTQFANATYATLVALNQKINWISGQSQAFTNSVTTGVDTQFITFPAAFTGGAIPTVQVTLDIPSNSDYMYNVAIRNVTTSGFTALYSDVVLETGVVLNVWASKLYGSI